MRKDLDRRELLKLLPAATLTPAAASFLTGLLASHRVLAAPCLLRIEAFTPIIHTRQGSCGWAFRSDNWPELFADLSQEYESGRLLLKDLLAMQFYSIWYTAEKKKGSFWVPDHRSFYSKTEDMKVAYVSMKKDILHANIRP